MTFVSLVLCARSTRQLVSDCCAVNMGEEDLSWLTQSAPVDEWRRPETATFVRYVYDDDEFVEPVGNEIVIRQHLPDNDRVCLQHIQNGLIDNIDTEHPPLLSLQSSVDSSMSSQLSDQQTQ